MSDEESTAYYTLLCDDPSHELVLVDPAGPSPLSLYSRAPAPERSGDRSRNPESARPRRPDGPATAQR